MDAPRIAHTVPFPLPVKKGDTVYWCACGLSQTQPYCDGSHKGTSLPPVPYTATRDRIVFFCGRQHSSKGLNRSAHQSNVVAHCTAPSQHVPDT